MTLRVIWRLVAHSSMLSLCILASNKLVGGSDVVLVSLYALCVALFEMAHPGIECPTGGQPLSLYSAARCRDTWLRAALYVAALVGLAAGGVSLIRESAAVSHATCAKETSP